MYDESYQAIMKNSMLNTIREQATVTGLFVEVRDLVFLTHSLSMSVSRTTERTSQSKNENFI